MIKMQKTAKNGELKKEIFQKIYDAVAFTFQCLAILAGWLVICATGICAYKAGWFIPKL